MTRASAATATLAALFALACADDGGREHADAEAGLSSDAGGADDAAYGDGEAAVGVDGDGGGAVAMDGGSTVLDASVEASVPPNEAGGEGSTGHSCPASCNLGLVCDPALGRCCACVVGESECKVSIGAQRRCVAGANGCGQWSDYAECGSKGCDTNMKECAISAGMQIEQWGEGTSDEIHALATSASGDAILVGYSDGSLAGQAHAGGNDLFVSARSRSGAHQWTYLAGTADYDSADGVVVDAEGNLYVAGQTEGKLGAQQLGARDAFVRKLRPDRSVEWTTQWGTPNTERVTDLARDSGGNLYVSGWTTGNLAAAPAGLYDLFVTKLSPAGSVLWSVQRGTSADDRAIQLDVDQTGNVFVAGVTRGTLSSTDTAPGLNDLFLMKVSTTGQVQWVRQWGSSEDDGALDVVALADGDLLVGGYSWGTLANATGQGGGLLTRLDASGNVRWAVRLGASNSDGVNRLALRGDVAYAAGVTYGDAVPGFGQGMRDIFVAAHKLDGSRLWVKQTGTAQHDEPLAIAVANDATVYVGGITSGEFPGFVLTGSWDNVLAIVRP